MDIHVRFWHKHIFALTLGKYLGVECLDHMVNICLVLLEIAKMFFKLNVLFCHSQW